MSGQSVKCKKNTASIFHWVSISVPRYSMKIMGQLEEQKRSYGTGSAGKVNYRITF